MNLLPEFGVGVDLVKHGNWPGKPIFVWVDGSKFARNEEPSSRGALNSGLASGDSGLQLNLEIAQAVSQRRSSPLFRWAEGALKRRVT